MEMGAGKEAMVMVTAAGMAVAMAMAMAMAEVAEVRAAAVAEETVTWMVEVLAEAMAPEAEVGTGQNRTTPQGLQRCQLWLRP